MLAALLPALAVCLVLMVVSAVLAGVSEASRVLAVRRVAGAGIRDMEKMLRARATRRS